jgi:hypothetical protein
MSVATIATEAEAAVRADYRAGLLPTDIDRYEAAQVELDIRAEAAGMNLSNLVLKATAAKVAANAVR